ncbi:MAG: disulfide bond formation protein DsbB [Saprospiraceae bacterium]|jgi:disulfide bond formation protein DsbB
MRSLVTWPRAPLYWAATAALCLLLETVALYYQYQLDYYPCVLCIHVRMLLAALLLISLIALITPKLRYGAFILATGVWVWMLKKSYDLFATENGWTIGECSMESGLPSWLALEKWFPWLFQIHEPCGYTPYLIMKFSMAQALLGLSVMAVIICIICLLMPLFKDQTRY